MKTKKYGVITPDKVNRHPHTHKQTPIKEVIDIQPIIEDEDLVYKTNISETTQENSKHIGDIDSLDIKKSNNDLTSKNKKTILNTNKRRKRKPKLNEDLSNVKKDTDSK